jgi:hypothetical protein
MSRFIQKDAGDWVNPDHIACVDRAREKDGRYKRRTADGTLVGIMRAGFDPDLLLLFPPSSHLCWEQPLARKPALVLSLSLPNRTCSHVPTDSRNQRWRG